MSSETHSNFHQFPSLLDYLLKLVEQIEKTFRESRIKQLENLLHFLPTETQKYFISP